MRCNERTYLRLIAATGVQLLTEGGRRRSVLITGGSRRIGRAIAIDLAAHGWRVAIHYGSQREEAERVLSEIEALGADASIVQADLADAASCGCLIDQATAVVGPLSCLINNASLFIEDDIASLDSAVWDRQMAVNLKAPVFLAKAFANALPAGEKGNIVNIIDQRVLAPGPEFLSYSLAKSGLYIATQMLAQALAPRIRVNGIGPGPVLPSIYQTEASFADEVGSTLLGLAVPPEEIAATVRFILDASSLTGQMIALDGGQHLARRPPG